jgi:GxxExxY protein
MPDKRVHTPHDQLTYRIVGCAMAVHRERGPGYREDTYQRDLEVHLAKAELSYQPQQLLEVFDSEQSNVLVGYYIPDFIVAESVVVEIKALDGLDAAHTAQLIGYLAVTGCRVGLLINFCARSLQWRRIFPPTKITQHKVNRQWLWVPDWMRQA